MSVAPWCIMLLVAALALLLVLLSLSQRQGSEALLPDVTDNAGRAPEFLAEDRRQRAFAWIREDNSQHARTERRKLAQMTALVTNKSGYRMDGVQQRFQSVEMMIAGTSRMAPSLGNVSAPRPGTGTHSTMITKFEGLAISAALKLRERHGNAVAVVSAASAYHCGGGFETGGRHALEEALCTQTTLYPSIMVARQAALAESSEHGRSGYIPSDGVVLSPGVEIFRFGVDSGYEFMKQPVQLAAVISVAMFNQNPSVRDAPVDMPREPAEYQKAVRLKFRSLMAAAIASKSIALVMPDVGCGVYGNDPVAVGKLFGEVLRHEFWGHFREVALVGKRAFQDAAQAEAMSIGRHVISPEDVVWEFQVRDGFKGFDVQCQRALEDQYHAFLMGGSRQGQVRSDGQEVVVDFDSMLQWRKGSGRKRTVRRKYKEKRQANDGRWYTWEQFEKHYHGHARDRWNAAPKEMRKANNGRHYTWEEFEQHYGAKAATHWSTAEL